MKNRLKALVASMTKQKDGYDPDDKTEHGGREHASREAIRGAVFADPFGDPTRRARRALLVVAVLTLIINARLPIDKITYLDSLPSEQSSLVILGLLSMGLVYFLIIFVVSAGVDLARWCLTADNLVLKHITDHVG